MEKKKHLIEFLESSNGNVLLKVAAYPLDAGEIEAILAELQPLGFKFSSIDSSSLYATLEDSYTAVYEVMTTLQADGWQW